MAQALFICTHEFVPELPDELALTAGDQVLILPNIAGEDDQDVWWTVSLP